ncbi:MULTISPECIES: GDP-mannose 4,6-dehydratase [Spirosoma]|uniref:NAD-dependent epimerase/dehydratase family protein n=1 Tax=Spirosoma sordidisoli TaxID=2502893 RepID=A0A4Q2UJD7_9BACT|nr:MULTISPECIES: GDP-mannose 4,6-dehydratase [Spirosoma]RYC67691.1 NAD-dependent epimerase/dehydratase family protein [Spirosoma sordidisoli]
MTRSAQLLVTGCAGFIGSHLTERLLGSGYRVIGVDNFDSFYERSVKERNLSTVLDNEAFTFIEADIRDRDWLTRLGSGIDAVIHIAAKAGVRPSIEQPADYISTNIAGTNNLLDWMREQQVGKMVFASSSSVYGNNEKIPFSETDTVDEPISPYAFTKRSCELLTHNYHHLYGMGVVNLRFFTVYGERQRPDLAIHKFVRMIAADQPIPMFGQGDTSRDYTYVSDTVDGIVAALAYLDTHPHAYEIINLGNNSPVTLQTLVTTLYRLMNKTPQVQHLPKQPGDVERTYADVSRAADLLGYQPKVSLEEGLSRFVTWYKTVYT